MRGEILYIVHRVTFFLYLTLSMITWSLDMILTMFTLSAIVRGYMYILKKFFPDLLYTLFIYFQ